MAYDYVKKFIKMIKNYLDKYIKVIRSHNGGEFTSNKFKQLVNDLGVIQQFSYPHTRAQNARVERKHRHLLNVARALHFQANVPLIYWGECILTASYLINKTPSKVLDIKTPFEVLNNRQPDYSLLKTFGCLCFVTIENKLHKFSPRSFKGIFLGYLAGFKGYLVLIIENNKFYVSKNVVFKEDAFPFLIKLREILIMI